MSERRKRVVAPPEAPGEPLHTKYRPKSFSEVIGQNDTVNSLKSLLKAKSRPHTYLFTGGPGTGKTTLARILAAEFDVAAANLIEIDAGSSGGIDDMREATAPLRYQGFGASPNKAVIIDEAHQLSKQAWTSLLKTIEEPPPHVYFFFCTTELGKVPENIRTRCAAYNLKPVRQDDLLDLIDQVCESEGLDVPKKIRGMVAGACNGSPRLALVMLAAVQDCEDDEEAATLLASPLENKEVIDLCRLMLDRKLTWKQVTTTLKAMPEMPAESIRIVIANYLAACAMGARTEDDAIRVLDVLEPFAKPFPASDKLAPLLVALGRVVFP